MLNLAPVKERIMALASDQLGAGVEYETAGLSLFPRPGLVILRGTILRPGEFEVRLGKLTAGTGFLRLLARDWGSAKVRVEAPMLKLDLSGGDRDEDAEASVEAQIREEVASVVSLLCSQVRGIALEIEQGTIELRRNGRPVFRAEGLRGRLDSRSRRVTLELACRADLWQRLALTASITEALEGECRIRMKGLRPDLLLEGLLPSHRIPLADTDFDLEVPFDWHEPGRVEGSFHGSVPSLRMQSPDSERVLEDLRMNGSFILEEDRQQVSLDALHLGYPKLRAKAKLSVDSASPAVRIEAEGADIDLAELREVALTAASENPLVQEVFTYVRGGQVASLAFHAGGKDLADLGNLETLSARGRFKDASLFVPDPGWELEGVGGEIVLSPGLLEGKDLRGRLGKSSFSGTSLRLDLGEVLYVQDLAGDLTLSLDEIRQRLASLEGLRGATKELKSVQGTASIRVRDLSGPLERQDEWRFEAEGTLRGVLVETSLLPGPVKVPRGSFRVNRDSLFLDDVLAHLLDAECLVSGRLDGYREGFTGMEWMLSGKIGPEANRWVSEQIELSTEFRLRAPYEISESACRWERGQDLLLKGTLLSPRGPRVSADLALRPEGVVVRDLSIRDEASEASMGLKQADRTFHVAFRGRLQKGMLDDLLVENTILAGSVEGDLEAKIFIDRPMDSTATGMLRGEGLGLLLPLGVPVTLQDISVRAREDRIRTETARLLWEEQEFVLEGDASFSPAGLRFDLDVHTGDLEWSRIERALHAVEGAGGERPEADGGSEDGPGSLTAGGVIRVRADSFTFEEFTWRPVAVEIGLQRERLGILLKEANLCGVSTTGSAEILPQDAAIELAISCQEKRIEHVLDCIRVDADATGGFTFNANLKGRGRRRELLHALEGDFELTCREGTVLRDPVISALLAFLNTTEVLRGKVPDFKEKGFPYHSIQARGNLHRGELRLEEVVIDGTTVDIYALGKIDLVERTLNIRILASSLQTVEFIVSKIPVISYILGGRGITAIPVRVYGPMNNPRTLPLSPAALGEDLVGVMGRTLSLPHKAIKIFFPQGGSE